MDRRAKANLQQAIRASTLVLAGFCAGCANVTDPAGFSIVAQDKFDFQTCKEILGARTSYTARVKQLTEYIEKADSSSAGFLVSGAAYRSELVQSRSLLRAAERAAQLKDCEPPKKS